MKVNENDNMLQYVDIIKEVAVSAVVVHCKECGCHGCQMEYLDDCCDKLQTYFTDKILVALAIERVKEKANESKD